MQQTCITEGPTGNHHFEQAGFSIRVKQERYPFDWAIAIGRFPPCVSGPDR